MKVILVYIFLTAPCFVSGQYIAYNPGLSELENFKNGFADTFYVYQNLFRIVADVTLAPEYRYRLDKYVAGQWHRRFSFGYGIGFHTPDYDRKADFNCDGYYDLVVYSSPGSVYLFDTATVEFTAKPLQKPYKWEVVDAKLQVLCSLDIDLKTGDGISMLYTFSGPAIYPFYYLEIKGNGDNSQKACILYKCENGNISNKTKTEELAINNETYDFYAEFWKSRYKKLMGYE